MGDMRPGSSEKDFLYRLFIIFGLILVLACSGACAHYPPAKDYRGEMRRFVISISRYAKHLRPDFAVIPQNGVELLTLNGEATGPPAWNYLDAIDGIGQESLFYGYDKDDKATPDSIRKVILPFLNLARERGLAVLVTDYCRTHEFMEDSYARNAEMGYLSFGAESRDLDRIPSYPRPPFKADSAPIGSLGEAKNFLYLINPGEYSSKDAFISAVSATDYDLVILDLFFGDKPLTPSDLTILKRKSGGGKRLVIAYMSIGEAEEYRYYWQEEWKKHPPEWLAEENPDWPGNYKVCYWDPEWQGIIFGNQKSYLKKILDAGFDGVYLDIIDAFQYFEDRDEAERASQ
ncbi:MAG: endo alpha-1,4 polygalactosaminidase [Deltaproteobacteria bacterium]|nr:endo alpha-1,4 polygalactosaminidase [Deltaproteobacteria bacterium]